MSSPPALRQDAFISYRQDNNRLLDEEGKGWVDYFHERLEYQLVQLIGRKAEIWRDPRLPKDILLVDYLQDRIRETIALVVLLSPGYLTSDWCMGELREFCARAVETGGLYVNGRSRIFAVVKLPPEGDKYPDEVSGQLRYEFFTFNPKTRRPEEFSPDLGRHKDQRYWNTISDLAWDLKELLREADRLGENVAPGKNIFQPTPQPAPSPDKKRTIYLAETTDDLAEQRRLIKEELILNNYDVLPRNPMPYVAGAYREEVKKNLAQAEASINLLGRTYGLIPDGAGDRSILRLQFELAAELANERSGFKRLIWMPEGWQSSDDKMNQMLQEVKMLANPHKGMEFLQTSLEEFKTLVHKRLTVSVNGHAAKATTIDACQEIKNIYLICDRRDISDATPLILYLQERGYDVVLPEFEEVEGETPLADLHQQNLLACDGVIVYYGHGSSRWVAAKRSDIEKHAGLEKTVESTRIRRLRAKAFYVTAPFSDLKQVFQSPRSIVIKNFETFDPASLNKFISDLEGENDNQGGNGNV
jgi:hypothetical protein